MVSIAGIFAVAILTAVRSAAPVGLPVRVLWEAPAGCSDADSFFAAVASRSERIHRAEPREEGARLEVKLIRLGTKVHGELRLITDDGRSDLRKVDGATCDEVSEALSLTAALALTAATRVGAPPVAGGQGATPGPAAGAPAAAPPPSAAVAPPPPAPVASPAPTLFPALPAAPTTPPASAVAPAVSPDLAPAPSPDLAPAAAAPPPPPGPSPPSPGGTSGTGESRPGQSIASWFVVGVGPAAGKVVAPHFSLGGATFLQIQEPGRDHLAPSAVVGFVYLRSDLGAAGDDAVFRLAAATVTACPGWGLKGSFGSVELCALGVGGWLVASDSGVTVSHTVTRAWWSGGAVLRARAPLGAGFAVQLDASASVPLVQRRFVTTTPEQTVGTSPSVAPIFALSVAHGL